MKAKHQIGHCSFSPDYKSQPAAKSPTQFALESALTTLAVAKAELATLRARVAAAEGLASAWENYANRERNQEGWSKTRDAFIAWRAAQGPQNTKT